MILMSFFSNLLEFICANNYHNIKRIDKIIAKLIWCGFIAPRCSSCIKQQVYSRCIDKDELSLLMT